MDVELLPAVPRIHPDAPNMATIDWGLTVLCDHHANKLTIKGNALLSVELHPTDFRVSDFAITGVSQAPNKAHPRLPDGTGNALVPDDDERAADAGNTAQDDPNVMTSRPELAEKAAHFVASEVTDEAMTKGLHAFMTDLGVTLEPASPMETSTDSKAKHLDEQVLLQVKEYLPATSYDVSVKVMKIILGFKDGEIDADSESE